MADQASSTKVLTPEDLAEYSKALKDYKATGITQCLSILQILTDAEITMTQLKDSKIGNSLSKIAKDSSTDPEEKPLKDAAILLFQKTKARESEAPKKPANGNSTTTEAPKTEKPKETKPDKLQEEKKVDAEPIKKKTEEQKNAQVKPATEKPQPVQRKPTPTKLNIEGIDKLPFLQPDYRNFTLKSFSDALLTDIKGNPQEKDRQRPVANKKAVELEENLNAKTRGVESDYRMEARNLTTFLSMKNNLDLRRRIMEGAIETREFVYNKEGFLNQKARTKIEEVSRRLLDASNADYSQKIVRDSSLYQCRKCKSKKISKEEKQTRSGDEPMTSFFNCLECGAGWKE